MKMHSLILPLAIVACGAPLANDALAQMGGMGGMGGMGSGRRGNRDSSNGSDGGSRGTDGRVERPATMPDANSYVQIDFRLSQLQEALKPTPEQGALWQSFAAKVRAYAEDLSRESGRSIDLRPGADTGPAQGLAHIAKAVDAARNRLAALEETEFAAKALYKTLSAEQKSIADVRLPAIVAPRTLAAPGTAPGSNLMEPGSGPAPAR